MDEKSREQAMEHWDRMAKPIASLGLFEENIAKIAGIVGSADPAALSISKRALLVFCADHGVVAQGVTQTGQEVTCQVAENFANGRSTVNILARDVHCDVYTVDIGMNTKRRGGKAVVKSLPYEKNGVKRTDAWDRIIDRKVGFGTKDMAISAAMSLDECRRALQAGIDLVGILKEQGYDILATGEMGIGNTTPTAALISAYLQLSPAETVGRGAGLSDAGLLKKREVVERALKRAKKKQLTDPLEILAEVGGFEIAGMAGVFLGGVKYEMPIMIDGVISAAAFLAAAMMDERVADYAIASHVSGEIVERRILEHFHLKAMIDAKLSLGEGSGCMAALPLLDMALTVYSQMGSFDDYAIASYHRFGNEPDRKGEA